MTENERRLTAEIMKAMGHPLRIRLVEALIDKEMSVKELNALVPINQSTLSRHLAQLKRSGVLVERREGTHVWHRVSTLCVAQLIKCCRQVLDCRLKASGGII